MIADAFLNKTSKRKYRETRALTFLVSLFW